MKKKYAKPVLSVLLATQFFLLSACGPLTNKTLSHGTTASNQVPISSVLQTTQANIELSPNQNAAEVPIMFYKYLSEGNYKVAVTLLGPQLQFEGTPSFIKYLKNIKRATFIKFEDISKSPGPIDPDYSKYYKIKVYYAVINIQVMDPSLVPSLPGINYRKIILIKKTPSSPWLIDTDEDTPKR